MRKTKIGILIIVFILITISSSFALRMGLEFGNPNAVLVLRWNPIDVKIGYNFQDIFGGGDNAFFHISLDYRIFQQNLIDFLNIYLAAGLYAQIQTAGEGTFSFGARIPVGLNAFLMSNNLEFFVEVVPTVLFLPGIAFGGLQGYIGFTIRLPNF